MDVKQLILDLRGFVPERCSFCLQFKQPKELEPEEAGDWVCHSCLVKWDAALAKEGK